MTDACCFSQADNIMNILNDKLQPGYLTNLDDFIAQLAKDAKFKPFGNLVHSYTVSKGKRYLTHVHQLREQYVMVFNKTQHNCVSIRIIFLH